MWSVACQLELTGIHGALQIHNYLCASVQSYALHIYHWAMPPELRKISHMAQNATLEKLPQWKITKIVVTRCQILRLKCTKFD